MMRIRILLFIQLTSFYCAIGQVPKVKIIPGINTIRQIEIETIGDRLDYIRLSNSNQSALIGNISRISVNHSFIVIYDNKSKKIFLFDIKGIYISTLLGFGKGPHEYLGVNSLDINDNNEILILFNVNQIIVLNAITNDLIQFSIKGTAATAKWLQNNIVVLRPFPYFITNDGFEITFINREGKILKNILKHPVKGIKYEEMTPFYSISRNGDELSYWNEFRDTVYTLTKELEIHPRLLFQHSPQRYPLELRKKIVSPDLTKGYIWDAYREFGNISFSHLVYLQKGVDLYINRSTGETVCLQDDGKDNFHGLKNTVDGGVDFWPTSSTTSGDLMTFIDPNDLREAFLKNKKEKIAVRYPNQQDSLQKYVIDKITLMDNPIIIHLRKK